MLQDIDLKYQGGRLSSTKGLDIKGGKVTPLAWINVRELGAVGDGSTDDTTVIQSAIDTVNAAGGGTVYIPRGTYKLTDALTTKDNVWLKGDGIAATVLTQTATNKHGIQGSNLELVGFEGLMVDGPGSGTGTGIHLDGTAIIYSFYVTMRNVMVRQFGDTGVLIDDPVTTDLYNVTSKENGAEGFYITCSDTGAVGTSTSLISCYAHNNAGNGFRLYNMAYSTFTGCASDNNVNGYKIEACESVTLTGCGAEQNSGDSIQISGGNCISVFGAWLSESGTNGVHVTGSAHVVTLKGIKEFSSASTPTFIKVDSGSTVTVENCKSDTRSNSFAAGTTMVLSDTSLNQTIPGTLTVSGNVNGQAGVAANGIDISSVQAGDYGLLCWSYDPTSTTSTTTTVANTNYLSALYVRRSVTVSKLWFIVNVLGATATAGANNVGLYNSAGTLLSSVNVDSLVTTTGPKSATLGTPVSITPGLYWVAMQFQAATQPGIGRSNAAILSTLTLNQSAATYRFATNGTGTTLPSTITPASNSTTGSAALWAGIS
ncbi:right-handed parallel beta-helix repeat-containing protein [Streptomyces sp. MBT65]|uniref:right-handed parallel beta-helix repeat-containing protein n=1 Tax=Streptomyces sp. MBT65 TaxID=1488395 RepID=UPI00190DC166|nr:right-handed parallel beta-helix repeat-containing protein [Streptomyces sp. MBT65]MBK3573166.1 right-handed parallel beta-helix repeat-containing protein [Streptomyces sp. MBT65]